MVAPLINYNHFFLMLQSDRQTSTIHQHDSPSSHHDPPKKKQIRKDRETNLAKLSKQQKMRLQKQKNRQAAQRSRDQHREYVSNLQRQVKELKEQLQLNKHYCRNCKKTLSSSDMFQEEELINLHLPIEHQSFHNKQAEPVENSENVESEPDYLMRAGNQNEDEFSYLKLILFVAMIVVAVCLFPSSRAEQHSRNLIERFTPPKSIINDQASIASQQSDPHQPLIDLNNSLVVRNSILNEQCLSSLIEQRTYSLANLRTSHASLGQMNEGILLCSFEQQKQDFPLSNNEEKSTFLRLFLLGTQIKEMISTHSSIKNFIQSNIQLNGIYRIAAEIKQIELIPHHNCLL